MSTSASAVHGDAVIFADSDLGRLDFEIFVEFKLYVLQIKDKKSKRKNHNILYQSFLPKMLGPFGLSYLSRRNIDIPVAFGIVLVLIGEVHGADDP